MRKRKLHIKVLYTGGGYTVTSINYIGFDRIL